MTFGVDMMIHCNTRIARRTDKQKRERMEREERERRRKKKLGWLMPIVSIIELRPTRSRAFASAGSVM